jgi:hypothetical protein
MASESKGCIVCGEPVKAKYLCAKHHQRYIRSGSVYLIKEKVDDGINYDKVLKEMGKTPKAKEEFSLSRFI